MRGAKRRLAKLERIRRKKREPPLQAQQMITASLTKHLPTLEDAKKETRKASLWSRVRSRLG